MCVEQKSQKNFQNLHQSIVAYTFQNWVETKAEKFFIATTVKTKQQNLFNTVNNGWTCCTYHANVQKTIKNSFPLNTELLFAILCMEALLTTSETLCHETWSTGGKISKNVSSPR